MFGDQIAENLWRLAARLISARSNPLKADAERDGQILAKSDDDSAEDTRPKPYQPDYHDERSDSSLHISC